MESIEEQVAQLSLWGPEGGVLQCQPIPARSVVEILHQQQESSNAGNGQQAQGKGGQGQAQSAYAHIECIVVQDVPAPEQLPGIAYYQKKQGALVQHLALAQQDDADSRQGHKKGRCASRAGVHDGAHQGRLLASIGQHHIVVDQHHAQNGKASGQIEAADAWRLCGAVHHLMSLSRPALRCFNSCCRASSSSARWSISR